MTTIQLIAIPYDSGHRGERMGAGPEYLIAASALTAYDPTCDPEGKIFRAGTQLMEHMIRQIESSQGVDHLAEKREKP